MPLSLKKLHSAIINGEQTKCLLIDFHDHTMVVFADPKITAHYKAIGFEVILKDGELTFQHMNDILTEEEARKIWNSLYEQLAAGHYSQTFFMEGKAAVLA